MKEQKFIKQFNFFIKKVKVFFSTLPDKKSETRFSFKMSDKLKTYKDFLFEKWKKSPPTKFSDVFLKNNTKIFLQSEQNSHVQQLNQYLNAPKVSIQKKGHKKNRIINLVGRKDKPKIKVTQPNGEPLTPNSKKKVSSYGDFNISFSPGTMQPNGQLINASGEKFNQCIKSRNILASLAVSPQKPASSRVSLHSIYSLENKKPISEMIELLNADTLSPDIEKFNFNVTRAELNARCNLSRPISQQQVMRGKRAIDVLKTLGAIIFEKENGRNYHWAHLQGWGLGGAQASSNLIPTTAGSNYDTLFKVENPIYDLLQNERVAQVNVCGMVLFHSKTRVPIEIFYGISTNRPEDKIYVTIDPLSRRIPTVEESHFASILFGRELVGTETPPNRASRKLSY